MVYNAVIVRPGEYMVRKGSPIRRYMISRLIESIRRKFKRIGIAYDDIKLIDTRITILNPDKPLEASIEASKIFGVSNTSPGVYIDDPDIDSIYSVVEDIIVRDKPTSIALRVRGRLGDLGREDIIHILASRIIDRLNIYFNLTRPDKEIIIESYEEKAFITDKIFPGVGGLPYGVEGCLVALVSGGVDSALASWLAMKRGVRIIPVFIDYGSYWGVKARKRIDKFIELLYRWTPWDHLRIYWLPGYEDLVLKANIPARLRCLFCKANMYRVAGYIVERERCKGIVTGEAVGQVASQTLQNLYVLSRLTNTPIFRPVAFMDKLEIVKEAEKLGFGELNVRVEPCMLRPDKPVTAASERDYMILSEALKDTEEEAYRIFNERREIIDLGG